MGQLKSIVGAGGGKGAGSSQGPTEAPDSLQSKAYAKLLDLVCEGEIGGLVNGAQSVFLDDTPIQNADLSYNFQNVTLLTVPGTQSQSYIPGFSDTESETAVGTQVLFATPVIRQIVDASDNRLRITLGFPALLTTNLTSGDTTGASVGITIEVQPNGGSYSTIVSDTITGKTRSRYQRSYEIPLTGSAPWNIRVKRASLESQVSSVQDQVWWDSYTEIVDSKFSYPNSALVGIQIDASQFNNVPVRGYDMKLLKVKIPSNYNPIARTYTGTWDGTFQVAWTDNPAWCFYDLITNTRYGLGSYIDPALVDKWGLYAIAQYCDQLVPDGYGGTEPRFTMNVYLQSQAEAYKVVSDLASVFRGMAYWSSGSLVASQDSPADPVQIFTLANIVGDFNYAGAARKARHTAVVVQYNDPNNRYKLTPEYVEGDPSQITRFGVREELVVAFGCSSRGQANRVGRWILFTEQYEAEVITFEAGLDSVYCRPGDIIKIADQGRAGTRMGGRLLSAASDNVTIDNPVTLAAGHTYTLTLVMPDGTLQDRILNNSAGSTSVLTFAAALPSTDIVGTLWVLAADNLQPQLARVVGIGEATETTIRISALAHYPSKYALVENGLQLQTVAISQLSNTPSPVASVTVEQELYIEAATVKVRMVAHWGAAAGAATYRVLWRRASGNWTLVPQHSATMVQVEDISPDTYEVKVYAVGAFGDLSVPTTGSAALPGKGAPPANVTGFTATKAAGSVRLTWNAVPDLDVAGYEIRQGASWATGTPILADYAGTSYPLDTLPVGTTTLFIAAIDTTEHYSSVPAQLDVTINALGTPVVSGSVVGTNAQLSWAAISSDFQIDHYEIRVGSSWNSAAPLTTVKGTSYPATVDWLGNQTFLVAGVDVAGNVSGAGSVTVSVAAPSAPAPTISVAGENYVLAWAAPASTLPIVEYEVRYGSTFAGGTVVGRVKGTTYTAKVTWGGNRTIWLAAIDSNENIGAAGSTALNIDVPGSPTITQQTIDNNVLFSWNDVTRSLPIKYYEMRKGSSFALATVIGTVGGRFQTLFESAPGTYMYWIVGVDSAGNYGTESSTAATVNQPPGYVLYANQDSQFDSTNRSSVLSVSAEHYALSLNGSTQWGQLASIPSLDGGVTGITFEAFFFYDSSGSYGLIEKTVGGAINTSVSLLQSSANLTARVVISSTQHDATYALPASLLGSWVHAIGRWDSTNGVQIAVQGVNQATTVAAGTLDQGAGALYVGTLAGASRRNGQLGPCRVYARRITDTEVGEHYRGIYKDNSRLVASWNFSEGSGSVAYDDTDNSYDLTLEAAPPFVQTALDGRFDLTAGLPQAFYPVKTEETFAEHFTNNAWSTIQDAINAYSHGLSPAPTTAQYVEVFDMGAVLAATRITVTLTGSTLLGTVTITPKISTSHAHVLMANRAWALGEFMVPSPADGSANASVAAGYLWEVTTAGTSTGTPVWPATVTLGQTVNQNGVVWTARAYWTDYAGVWSAYGTQFQYVKITLDISCAGGAHLGNATLLNRRLDVKQISDSGTVACSSSDLGGTQVNFNISFLDVSSITVTPQGTTPATVVVDFTDAPNPTGFKVLLFDPQTGNRLSLNAGWAAAGV